MMPQITSWLDGGDGYGHGFSDDGGASTMTSITTGGADGEGFGSRSCGGGCADDDGTGFGYDDGELTEGA